MTQQPPEDKKVGGIMDSLGEIQKIAALLHTLATVDINHNNQADWIDLIALAKAAFALLAAWKVKMPTITLANVMAEFKVLETGLADIYAQAAAIIGPDFKVFASKNAAVFDQIKKAQPPTGKK